LYDGLKKVVFIDVNSCKWEMESLNLLPLVVLAGLHLGNDSRGGKIRFYESKGGGGNGVKIDVHKHIASRRVWEHALPGNF